MYLDSSQRAKMTLTPEQVRSANAAYVLVIGSFGSLRLCKVVAVTDKCVWVKDQINKTGRAVLKGRVIAALTEAEAEQVRQAQDMLSAEREQLRAEMQAMEERMQDLLEQRDRAMLSAADVVVPASDYDR